MGLTRSAPRFFRHRSGHRVAATALALATASATGASALSGQEEAAAGKALYDRWCAACHGESGDGQGPGAEYMLPRPRDFTTGLYQIRTTASGELPTDADILRVIDRGIPGTTMPGWRDLLSQQEREALVEYLKGFSRFFAAMEAPTPLTLGSPPRATEEALTEGAEFYESIECWQCHGQSGRGDGSSAPTLEDDADLPIRAADLTENWRFNGGGTVEDIYRTLRTGLDGTPMATFQEMVDAGIMTDEQLWNLAHYVRSLAPEEDPQPSELISAALVSDVPLPTGVDDPAWDDVERFYVPLVGQIVLSPRWFDPRVDGLWVQALHDGNEVALRISWSDPSESPDPAWDEWRQRIVDLMEPKEAEHDPGPHPDRLTVQFPSEMPEDERRPYFLMGDTRRPVYLWNWTSQDGGAEMDARGFATELPQESQAVQAEAVFDEGQWQVLFRRALSTDDPADLQFPTGAAIPLAFFAWDGDNGEYGHRAAVSSWYFLALQEAPPVTVYVAPAMALALTALLAGLAVVRAQKREREASTEDE